MSIKRIDARGLSCPQPVVLTQKELKEGYNVLEVIVDNEVSKENILRLVKKNGMMAELREEGDDTVIIIEK